MNKDTLGNIVYVVIYMAVTGFIVFSVWFFFRVTSEHCEAVKTKDLPYAEECVRSSSPNLNKHYVNKYCKAVANKKIPPSSAFCDLCVKDMLLKNKCNKAMMQTIINNN